MRALLSTCARDRHMTFNVGFCHRSILPLFLRHAADNDGGRYLQECCARDSDLGTRGLQSMTARIAQLYV